MLGGVISINILVWFLAIPISDNFVFGNHLVESLLILNLLAFLTDLNILKLNNGFGRQYIKIGLIAFFSGIAFQILSFASLMYGVQSSHVVLEWLRIAPITIIALGIPVLWISDKISHQRQLFGYSTIGIKGLIANFLICFAYTFFVGYLLFSYGYLGV